MNGGIFSLIHSIPPKKIQLFIKKLNSVQIKNNRTEPICIKSVKEDHLILLSETFRHILLTKIPGSAITKLKINSRNKGKNRDIGFSPVLHEFSHIPGIVENMSDIIANFQKATITLKEDQEKVNVSREIEYDMTPSSHTDTKEVFLGDILVEGKVERIVNPDLKLLTLHDPKLYLFLEIQIEKGIGFKTAEELRLNEEAAVTEGSDVLAFTLDANFNPVVRVGYQVNRGEIFFEIDTDGSISASDAFQYACSIFSEEVMDIRVR